MSTHAWSDMIDHYKYKGLISSELYYIAEEKLEKGENPFTNGMQKALARKAMEKRITLGCSFIDRKYEDMTLLWCQEAANPIFRSKSRPEKVTDKTFELLEKLVSWEYYTIEGIRPTLYEIRATLDPHKWTLAQVVEIFLGLIKDAESKTD
ncbi:MAG: hypothetical protein ACFFD4_07840 [Candidatus Odinarchaeota archaeon]